MLQLAIEPRKSLFNPALVASFQTHLGTTTYALPQPEEDYNEDAFLNAHPEAFDDFAPKRHRPRRLEGIEAEAAIAACGSWSSFLNPEIGTRKRFQDFCGRKTCPICGPQLGLDYYYKLARLVPDGDTVQYIELPDKDVRQFLRRFKNKLYLRLPQANGISAVFVVSSTKREGVTLLSKADLEKMDWTALQNSPEGRNISGSVLKASRAATKEKEEAAKGTTIVVHMEFVQILEEHAEKAHQCELLALKDTLDLEPNGATLQADLNTRQRAFAKYLKDAEVPYTSFPGRKRVKLSVIDWNTGITQSIAELVQYGLVSKDQLDTILARCTPAQVFEALNSPAVRHLLET